jgi:alcohol dehydrogenase
MATARLWSPGRIIAVDLEQSRLETAVKEGIADFYINSGKEDALAKIREMTDGRGADVAIEAVGFKSTLALALNCARANGRVSAVGAFTEPMEFDLPNLWMKNLTINMSLVCLKNIPLLIKLIEEGKLNARFLITHRAPLNEIAKGYDVFGNKKENCLKWIVTPYER